MRLICPNCDAQYEVPDEVIPAAGRDVQCSNCGQTWFQHHGSGPDEESDADAAPEAADETDPDPQDDTPPPPDPAPAVAPQPRQLDPSVADILRQEAEAEQAARKRRQQGETLDSQPDLGLENGADPQPPSATRSVMPEPGAAPGPDRTPTADQPDTPPQGDAASDDGRSAEARARMARLRGEPIPAEPATSAAAVSSRRELLPDIEEINSTLRSGSERPRRQSITPRRYEEPEPRKRRTGGFRAGFALVLALAAILALLYAYAPQIARAVPQVDPWLSAYVAQIDSARLALDAAVQDLLRWLDDKAAQSGG
ncbi:zinc-ribbon domain-containing protein [Sulfitobacter aestuarii]|uniref:Zinc-ribbon domain-containing protein n=1 Tax=Sulfitobacter aestuarii TaxID=2161676 RepID=A0ABW5U4N4_9RHOB